MTVTNHGTIGAPFRAVNQLRPRPAAAGWSRCPATSAPPTRSGAATGSVLRRRRRPAPASGGRDPARTGGRRLGARPRRRFAVLAPELGQQDRGGGGDVQAVDVA